MSCIRLFVSQPAILLYIFFEENLKLQQYSGIFQAGAIHILFSVIQSNLPFTTTQNVKSMWSLTRAETIVGQNFSH